MDQYGLRRACQWSGNSASTAMKTYALVKKCDFEDVGMAEKVDAKSDAISAVDAKCDAESASTTEQKPRKKSTVENSNSLPCISVGDIGLEPTTSTMSNESCGIGFRLRKQNICIRHTPHRWVGRVNRR